MEALNYANPSVNEGMLADTIIDNWKKGRAAKKRIEELRAAKVANPALANITDLVPWVQYDRVSTAAGATTSTQYVFFQQPIGTNNKTKVDTNMEQVMRLPDPEWMDVQFLSFSLQPNIAAADAYNMLSNYYWEFWIGNKVYAEGPMEVASSKTGLWAGSNRADSSFINLGNPDANGNADGGFDLRLPQGIELTSPDGQMYATNGIQGCRILQGQQFQVKLIGTAFAAAAAGATFGTGIFTRCYLKGIKSRIAQ